MKLTDFPSDSTSTTNTQNNTNTPSPQSERDFHDEEHELNDNWEWSDEFTSFIFEHISGFSLKVCPGRTPVCDVNLDLKDLTELAQSDDTPFSLDTIQNTTDRLQTLYDALLPDRDANLIYGQITADTQQNAPYYDGYAAQGDMFDIPFRKNTFDTTVSDPPWLQLTSEERKTLFNELVRVTKPTGKILYNATWIPEHTHTRQFKLRFRQERDFWGGPSFAAFYRRTSKTHQELFEIHDYSLTERYPRESPYWSEAYPPTALSLDHNTDPKLISGDTEHAAYCCPMCGCTQLDQLRSDDFFENETGEYTMYQCLNCEFRVDKTEVEALANALQNKAGEFGIPVTAVEHVEYTPPSVANHRTHHEGSCGQTLSVPFDTDLPWVPN